MKPLIRILFLTSVVASPSLLQAQDLFTGDKRLACEAILCLSTGGRPSECTPAITRFFDIRRKKFSDTLNARRGFLKLCPSASQDGNMADLVDAITDGAGRCDVAAINASSTVWVGESGDRRNPTYYVRDTLPNYCSSYISNTYTDIEPPVYVGIPERGGRWVDQIDYESALIEYNARIEAEDEEYLREYGFNGFN